MSVIVSIAYRLCVIVCKDVYGYYIRTGIVLILFICYINIYIFSEAIFKKKMEYVFFIGFHYHSKYSSITLAASVTVESKQTMNEEWKQAVRKCDLFTESRRWPEQ